MMSPTQLKALLDDALSNPAYAPVGGVTYCNVAVKGVAAKCGCHEFGAGMLANEMIDLMYAQSHNAAGGDLTGSYPNPTLATTQTGAHTWSATQTFNGGVYYGTIVSYLPQTIFSSEWVAGSTQTWAVNMSTGAYKLYMRGVPTDVMYLRFNSDSSSTYYNSFLTTDGSSANASNHNATDGFQLGLQTIVYSGGYELEGTIVIGGNQATTHGHATIHGVTSDTLHRGGLVGWTYPVTGYPSSVTIYTSGSFTGHIILQKVN